METQPNTTSKIITERYHSGRTQGALILANIKSARFQVTNGRRRVAELVWKTLNGKTVTQRIAMKDIIALESFGKISVTYRSEYCTMYDLTPKGKE